MCGVGVSFLSLPIVRKMVIRSFSRKISRDPIVMNGVLDPFSYSVAANPDFNLSPYRRSPSMLLNCAKLSTQETSQLCIIMSILSFRGPHPSMPLSSLVHTHSLS